MLPPIFLDYRRHSSRRALTTALITVTCIATIGCGQSDRERVPTFPIQGTITFQGQPIPGAFITLHPQPARPEVPNPRANVGRDGLLKVTTFNAGDGAPEGEYVLTVHWYKPIKHGSDVIAGPNVIPRKYSSPATSDIKIAVVAGESQLPPIKL